MALSPNVVLLLLGLVLYLSWFKRSKLPPGPKGLPILGNTIELISNSKRGSWHLFSEWKDLYGDIFSFKMFNQRAIVLNSQKAVNDLLELRASIYSDRVRSIVAETMTGGHNIGFINVNPLWRSMRRATHEALNNRACNSYLKFQMRGSIQLALDFLHDNPITNEPKTLIGRSMAAVVASILYGVPPGVFPESIITDLNDYVTAITDAALPGSYLVNHLSFLKYLPGRWRTMSQRYYRQWSEQFLRYFMAVKEKPKDQDERPSLVGNLIENVDKHGLEDMESAWLAASLYAAGLGTSIIVTNWMIFVMVMFPDVQEKIHNELDHVVGRSRIPTFEDMDKLPYYQAVVKELLRWRPPTPIGLPRESAQDDMYNGYFIPKGSVIIPNILALNHDPQVYGPDAAQFKPERFLSQGEDGVYTLKQLLGSMKNEGHHSFGHGKRICPGRYLASNSLSAFLIVLWSLQFEGEAKDANGDLAVAIHSHPPPYKCTWKPRFSEVEEILAESSDIWR